MLSDMQTKNLPLVGIRVLDFTWILAGPFTTAMMADYGAEVIKVQSHKIANGTEQNDSYYFATLNRNKRSITLDMSKPEARDLALQLAGKCDIVIQNFTPRVMENWGLDYETFKKANPAIIMVNLSAMGNTGPWRDFAALADTIEALSGLIDPGDPLLTGYPCSDIVSGLFTFNAILAALEQRRQKGLGCNIDISEFEAMCSFMGPQVFASINNECPSEGNAAAPSGCYKCRGKDRFCYISVHTQEQWMKLRQAMGNPGWAEQPQFSSAEERNKNKEELDKHLGLWTAGYNAKSLVRLLQAGGIPCSVLSDASALAKDPQLKSRGFFNTYIHPSLGEITYAVSPLKRSLTSPQLIKPAPLLGEDNDYVFSDIMGIDKGTIKEYIGKKILY